MILILEGSNKVGKSTLAESIKEEEEKIGKTCVIYRKRFEERNEFSIDPKKMFEFMMNMFSEIISLYVNNDLVIVDRFHISEIVYGRLFRKYENEYVELFDLFLSHCRSLVLYIFSNYDYLQNIDDKLKYERIQQEFIKEYKKQRYTESVYMMFDNEESIKTFAKGFVKRL